MLVIIHTIVYSKHSVILIFYPYLYIPNNDVCTRFCSFYNINNFISDNQTEQGTGQSENIRYIVAYFATENQKQDLYEGKRLPHSSPC